MPPIQPTAQQRYVSMLMERIRQDRYPSLQLMDRVEAAFWTSQQIEEYLDLLLEKADESWYPSKQILDRIHRVLAYAAPVAMQVETGQRPGIGNGRPG